MERSFKTVPDDLRCRGVGTPSDGTFFVEYDLGPNSGLDTASDVDLDDPAEPDMQGLHGMARTSHCNLECSSYRGATGRT